jgi:hypothetical protein
VEVLPQAVTSFAARLAELAWVRDLLVAGSLATGDYVPGVSDLDLVAVVAGPVDRGQRACLVDVHEELDRVDKSRLLDAAALHPTWTHGGLVERTLSGVTRAELVRHGFPVFGRPPSELLPAMPDDQIRAAARAELRG